MCLEGVGVCVHMCFRGCFIVGICVHMCFKFCARMFLRPLSITSESILYYKISSIIFLYYCCELILVANIQVYAQEEEYKCTENDRDEDVHVHSTCECSEKFTCMFIYAKMIKIIKDTRMHTCTLKTIL